MESDPRRTYEPATVLHPGETVTEYLEFNGWSQRDLARRTELTPKTISEICSGKTPITPPTALALEKVFQRPAHLWLNLQRRFDEAQARLRAKPKSGLWRDWARRFPLREMKRWGFLDVEAPEDSEVDELLTFLGVSSPTSWDSVWRASNVAYRQTRKFRTSPEAVSVWVRAAELMAANLDVEFNEFREETLLSLLESLRKQTRLPPEKFIPQLESTCASAGVAVVWVPELPHTGVSGCARWLTPNKALIALTLRYKNDDQVWFTLFHEIGHILLHRKQRGFILDNAVEDLTDNIVDPEMQRYEEEANRFAEDTLVPPDSLSEFLKGADLSSEAILKFSEELCIGPGILIGRLQRDGVLQYFQGNTFKQKFHWKTRE